MKSFALACIAALVAAKEKDAAKPTGVTTSKASITITLDATNGKVTGVMGGNFVAAADLAHGQYLEQMLCVQTDKAAWSCPCAKIAGKNIDENTVGFTATNNVWTRTAVYDKTKFTAAADVSAAATSANGYTVILT